MSSPRGVRATPTPWCRHGRERAGRGEEGFTLIELVVVILILPIVAGALILVLLSVFSLQGSVANRTSDSADAQTVASKFSDDVQSAAMLTTDSTSSPQCGTGSQLLGLEWNFNQSLQTYQTVVSYIGVPNGSSNSENLVRQYCASGASATPTGTSVISYDLALPTSQPNPTITPSGEVATDAAAGWVSAQSVTGVSFSILEPGSQYSYTLVGLPGASAPANPQSTISPPTTECGFANPGTGTYAATLCFVDFASALSSTGAMIGTACTTTAGAGVEVKAGITNTPYTLSFCMTTSNNSSTTSAVWASPVPTYFDAPISEAFLGNNGFYTGIPGDPALYQTTGGKSSTITINDIQVLDSNGNTATGWQLVTGDAESTDANESITWTSDKALNLIPNSATSPYGNACAEPTAQNPAAVYLTGLGTDSVECAATVNTDKTGTVMLEADQPGSLSVQMVGAGLQAVFIGMLLP